MTAASVDHPSRLTAEDGTNHLITIGTVIIIIN